MEILTKPSFKSSASESRKFQEKQSPNTIVTVPDKKNRPEYGTNSEQESGKAKAHEARGEIKLEGNVE